MLGILAINLAGFAGPPADVYHPVTHGTPPAWDAAIYATWLVLCEGKMRALFAILFGASMELFVTRVDAHRHDGQEPGQRQQLGQGQALQLRRLIWLAVFGYLHWLLWWGDILFSYAVAGFAALALRQAPRALLIGGALLVFGLSQAEEALDWLPLTVAEAHVADGDATPRAAAGVAEMRTTIAHNAADGLGQTRMGLVAQAVYKLAHNPLGPWWNAVAEIGEALPYMLLGIVLLRSGFFADEWPRRRMLALAGAGLLAGGVPTLAFAWWAWSHGFPPAAMRLALEAGLGFPHLLMALGYAALIVLAGPRILAAWSGRRLAAAGRMAFSNYIGTSIVMTAIFHGWGLGLAGTVGTTGQAGFVLLGWALMLGWSAPWLTRFRQGPLEWLWRSLVDARMQPLKR